MGMEQALLCSPGFVPQITGGASFPGEVTAKLSVMQVPLSVNAFVLAILPTDAVDVDGPLIMNWLKSRRSWQILVLHCGFIR